MRPHSVLLVTLAVLAVLAALPLGKGKEEDVKASSPWPCCDNCGICTKKNPPQCRCMDFRRVGCHPKCKSCIKYTADGDTSEPPIYRCADILTNFCKRDCAKPWVGIELNAGSF